MQMWKNPLITAVAGVLIGFFLGWVLAGGQAAPPPAQASAINDPHAGVPGAPPLSGMPEQPPEGGRTAATGNPQLMEQARNLESLLATDPNNYQHLVQAGNVQYDLGNFMKAADFYERARTIRDDSPDVLTDLGVAYRETKQPAKAIALFDRAADMSDRHWQSRYNAAVVRLFDLNDPAGAREELDKLERLRGTIQGIPDLSGLRQEIDKRLQK